jgi:hypothetical protein
MRDVNQGDQHLSLGAWRRRDYSEPNCITGQHIGGDSAEHGEHRDIVVEQQMESPPYRGVKRVANDF